MYVIRRQVSEQAKERKKKDDDIRKMVNER
jgi:hypothetical protein